MLGFKDLMSLVGEFLFRWSAMEQELSKAINLVEGGDFKQTNVRGELKERLDRWKRLQIKDANRPLVDEVISQIEELRSIRNLIVHGLAGVSALYHLAEMGWMEWD